MTEKTKFTKREWIHLIITLSIVQAGIWFVSFVYANNSSALGYISFAGTIISIILAVLAIGYTYGESQQQKNSSDTLGNQIESLIKIKDKLEIQAEALDDIKILKNTLVNFTSTVDEHFRATNRHVIDMKVNLMSMNQKPLATVSNEQQSRNNQALLKKLEGYDNTYATIVFSVVAIFCDQSKKFENYAELYNFINESPYGESGSNNTGLMLKSELSGSCVMTCNFLIMIGLLNYSNDEMFFDKGFIDFLKICEQRLQRKNSEGFDQSMLDRLHSDLKNTKYFNA